ncbi:MAG: response regulator transcription factor [Acutalibacteraceae bacterium]|nr:response regulator transcription factor [Acutalibacteraceae bacterium]
MYRILLVEDDKNIQELVCNYFTKKEKNLYKVEVASDGQIGLEKAYENNYDLLLLDVMLPELDGFEICKEIRKESDVPIMFITARANESDILGGYALGCDDYVIKPFPLPVLYEKANALIKRSKGLVRSKIFSVGSLSLNPNNGLVISDGREVKLTAREYAILKVLLENKGVIISREKLMDIVWGYNSGTDERVLDTHMRNLRKALGTNGKIIKTVIRRGYKAEDI